MPNVTIRINILTNFILLITLITTLLLGVQYYHSNKLALSAVDKTFNQVSNDIVNFISRQENVAGRTLNTLALNPYILESIQKDKTHPMLSSFTQIMNSLPNVKGLYIGHENGDFFEVINLKNDPKFSEIYAAPKESEWALLIVTNEGANSQKTVQFLNQDLNVLYQKSVKNDYFLKSRDWYKAAIASDVMIRTDVYKFASTGTKGITFAKKVPSTKTVVGVDLTLTNITSFLEKTNFDTDSHIILYTQSAQLVATSQKTTPYDWDKLLDFFRTNKHNTVNMYKDNGVEYFSYHNLPDYANNTDFHVGVLVPKENLLAPYMEIITDSLYAAIVFVLLTTPIILYSISLIVKPVNSLMVENEKIKNRKFNEVESIKTNIIELSDLSASQVSVSKSIQEYQLAQEKLLDSIIKLIAEAIDAKSTYTGGHCERVPELAEMLVKAASDSDDGVFKEFKMEGEDAWREFHIGAWLHDCGKVTTPEYVVDKSTKLETINNRIHEVRTRFEVLYRDAQIEYLESQLNGFDKQESLAKLTTVQNQLIEDFNFIANSNIGGEFMDEDKQEHIRRIGEKEWIRHFDDRTGLSDVELLRYEGIEISSLPASEKLLSDKQEHIIKREHFDYDAYKADGFKDEVPEHLYNYGELYNLCLEKGTLTHEERFKINEHVIMSIKMLEQLPFPEHLSKIPEYAGTHHETLIGTGYPRRLTKEQLSVPARIMAIADIFEALTASDRPYKKAKTLSESIKIMSFMVKDQHIDADLFELFLRSGIYMEYAKNNLKPEQIDEFDVDSFYNL